MFEKIMKWYKWGLWNKEQVMQAAQSGVITAEQAGEILGSK